MKHVTALSAAAGLLAGLFVSSCVNTLQTIPCAADGDCPAGTRCVDKRCLDDGSAQGGGAAAGGAGGAGGGAQQPACATAADCEAKLAAAVPLPVGCAEARCTAGACEFLARDKDGDGERAATCSATVSVATGPDCNDEPDAGETINTKVSERCATDGLDENCNGTVDEGCGCPVVGVDTACCSGRGTQTCVAADGGGATLSACTAPLSIERCNGLDDDCNGQRDDAVTWSLDGGAEPLDGGAVQADGGCSVGVGACARQGTATCSGGALGCSVAPGAPGTETCNAIDDNCDGRVDENPSTLCPISGQNCLTGGSCACPTGQTVCGTACRVLGGACSVGVGACLRNGTLSCIGGVSACSATAGTPGTETCDGIDNNCNGSIDEGTKVTCYGDADNDRYATSSAATDLCPDNNRAAWGRCPNGYVAPANSLGTDCAPNDPNTYTVRNTSQDSDGDGRCAGGGTATCVGTSPPGGRRFSETCVATSDCNDANGGVWQNLTYRQDSDGDGWCVGGAVTSCLGNSYPGGTRASTSCSGNDCFDGNGFATSTCYFADPAYTTQSANKACGIGPPPCEVFDVGVDSSCPAGFYPTDLVAGLNAPSTCDVLGATTLRSCCGGIVFGTASCRIRGGCRANGT